MPTDRSGEPWAGATYKGFSGASATPPPVAAPVETMRPRRRRATPALMAAGVAAALAFGVGFGFLARPELGGGPARNAAAAPDLARTEPPPGAAQVPIAVNPPPRPAPAPRSAGKLTTLPPEIAAAARARPQSAPASEATAGDEDDSAATPSMRLEPAPAPPQAVKPAAAAAPQLEASFDCATARPGAEQIVCSDPALAADDRRLARAYRRALRSGADPYDLRQEQHDWIGIREDAARHSRQALAQVYDQRIQELNQIAGAGDAGPDSGGDYDGE